MADPLTAALVSAGGGIIGNILSKPKRPKAPTGGEWKKFYEEGPKQTGLSPWDWAGTGASGQSIAGQTQANTSGAEIRNQFKMQKLQNMSQIANTAMQAKTQRYQAELNKEAQLTKIVTDTFNSGNPGAAQAIADSLGINIKGLDKMTSHKQLRGALHDPLTWVDLISMGTKKIKNHNTNQLKKQKKFWKGFNKKN